MKVILLMVAAFVLVESSDVQDDGWSAYKKKYDKNYGWWEDKIRHGQFLVRKIKAYHHNNGVSSYKMGINYFTDLFNYELKRYLYVPLQQTYSETTPFRKAPEHIVPASINWLEKGAVTSVKNQKKCASSYAFSAAGALEGLMFRAKQTVESLSAQQLVDCDMRNYGCNGGWPQHSFDHVKKKQRIDTDWYYPYVAKQGKCEVDSKTNGTTCAGYMTIHNETNLKEVVGLIGPASILYSVDVENFFMYESGIYDGGCGPYQNHAMLAVGYDKDDGLGNDYWLIKNSWSDDWGEKGYVKIIRNVNKCRLGEKGSIPTMHDHY